MTITIWAAREHWDIFVIYRCEMYSREVDNNATKMEEGELHWIRITAAYYLIIEPLSSPMTDFMAQIS